LCPASGMVTSIVFFDALFAAAADSPSCLPLSSCKHAYHECVAYKMTALYVRCLDRARLKRKRGKQTVKETMP
jgi:hypothetical protein